MGEVQEHRQGFGYEGLYKLTGRKVRRFEAIFPGIKGVGGGGREGLCPYFSLDSEKKKFTAITLVYERGAGRSQGNLLRELR